MNVLNKLPDLKGINLLFVDDNELSREVAVRMFQKVGIEVKTAKDGKEAVDLFLSKPNYFHIILMDLQMPVMNGYEAAGIIREHDSSIPIIALSASSMVDDRKKVLEAGMNDNLGKPIDMYHLFNMIASFSHRELPKSLQAFDADGDDSLLDIGYLLAIVEGKREVATKLFSKFLIQLEGEFADIANRVANRDLGVEASIHALKGLSGNLGAKLLSKQCSQIGTLLKEGDPITAETIKRLNETIKHLKETIKEMITAEKEEIAPIQELGKTGLKTLYWQVMNDLKMGKIVHSASQRSLKEGLENTVHPEELIRWEEAMDAFDYDKALNIMTGWKL